MADLRGMPADLSRFYAPPLTLPQLRHWGVDEPGPDPLADFKRALELTGERWLSFSEAVALLLKREPMSMGQAEAIIDDLRLAYFADGGPFARQSGKSTAVRWQWFHDTNFLTNKPNRGNTFVSEADLIYWHDRNRAQAQSNEPSMAQTKPRSKPRRSGAKEIIEMIWPDGIPPHVENALICREVGKLLKADNRPALSDDTILRAAGRKS